MQKEKYNYSNKKIYGIALIAVLGGFLFGYDTAVISGTVESLNRFFVLPYQLGERGSNTLLGFIVSCALIGCVIGSSLGGILSQKLGRKKSMLIAAVLFTLSSIGSAWPEIGMSGFGKGDHTAIIPFIIYRVIGGVGIGLASMLSPMYIAEIAPKTIRGSLVAWYQLAIVTGILIVYFVNYLIAQQGTLEWLNSLGWRWMFASEFVPAVLFFILLWLVPESPRWLILTGKPEKGLRVLTSLIGAQAAQQELKAISDSARSHNSRLFSFGFLVLVVGMLLAAFQQLIGINVVIYYAPEVFRNVGNSHTSALLQTVLVGVTNLIFTIVAIKTVDRLGRKALLLIGSLLMMIFMGMIGFSFYFQSLGILTLVSVLGFVGTFSFSWGPVIWVLLAEIFPNAIRSKAMALAVALMWIMNYTVSSTFPILDRNSWLLDKFNHAFSFWLFSIIALLSFVFVWKMVPETKGTSLEDVEKLWNK